MAVHLAKGARDFLPDAMRNRQHVMGKVRAVFERYGFDPIDTPAFERIETLTGKYGDEGEKLMFRILARGEEGKEGKVDMALRYDLTVPLARVVAMNPALRMPFKRWQMAPVWRADRPQRGRFREFWQCDVDIVGAEDAVADAECLAVGSDALRALGFERFQLRLNDRRILRAIARAAGAHDRELALLIIIDKLDKIGRDGVTEQLRALGLDDAGLERLWSILDVPAGHHATLDALAEQLDDDGKIGVATLRQVLDAALALGVPADKLVVDPTLARGLDYYTGPVYEAVLLDLPIGSVAGGGRYDGLVGMFSGRQLPAVGISLGIERLITVMEEQGMLPTSSRPAEVLVTMPAADSRTAALTIARGLREAGLTVELYLRERKTGDQLKYANERGFRWVAFVGEGGSPADPQVRLKDMESGSQSDLLLSDVGPWIRSR